MDNTKKSYRFERKYLLGRDAAFALSQRASYVLQPDASGIGGRYSVSSLYFDDLYNSSFHEKQNGVLVRDKFRARHYDGSMGKVRLERKHKHGDMAYKESAPLTLEQYLMMCHGGYGFMAGLPEPVFGRFYTAHVLRHMRPVITVDYDRQAYMHPAGNVRITFDSGLSASIPNSGRRFSILSDEHIIMEVKYDHFMPSFIEGLLTGAPLTQLTISKFVMAKLAQQGMLGYSMVEHGGLLCPGAGSAYF